MENGHVQEKSRSSTVVKEFFFGLLAVALGSYNLLCQLGYLKSNQIPQLVGNALLVIVGIVLWITAFRLWRYKWHSRRLF